MQCPFLWQHIYFLLKQHEKHRLNKERFPLRVHRHSSRTECYFCSLSQLLILSVRLGCPLLANLSLTRTSLCRTQCNPVMQVNDKISTVPRQQSWQSKKMWKGIFFLNLSFLNTQGYTLPHKIKCLLTFPGTIKAFLLKHLSHPWPPVTYNLCYLSLCYQAVSWYQGWLTQCIITQYHRLMFQSLRSLSNGLLLFWCWG